jgi:hypothetical protein
MTYKIIATMTVISGLFLAIQTASAGPMMCSGEETTCIAACQGRPRALIGDCIAACRTRGNYCKRTGCWDSGISRYCGLLRQ